MTGIWFPGLTIPMVKIKKGRFLNVSLLGKGIKVPPIDLTIIPKTVILKSFKLFDTLWIINPITNVVKAIPQAVWDLCKSTLDEWAGDFYKRRGAEKE